MLSPPILYLLYHISCEISIIFSELYKKSLHFLRFFTEINVFVQIFFEIISIKAGKNRKNLANFCGFDYCGQKHCATKISNYLVMRLFI